MVIGLPRRSRALPAWTRIQPSLIEYSSTLSRSMSLKRTPTPRSSALASWKGLAGLIARWSGGVSLIASFTVTATKAGFNGTG